MRGGGAERTYRATVVGLSVLMIVLGAILLARTIEAGGGPLAIGTLIGVALVGIGMGRIYVARGMRP